MKKICKRKHYALINPIAHAIEGARITPGEQLDKLRLRDLASIEAFGKGKAGLQEWSDINALLTMCETMARGGVGPEAMEACESAQAALVESARRFETTKRMGTSGLGLQAFRDLFEYHDLQRQSVSRGEYERWIQSGVNRLKSNAPEVVTI